MLRAKFVQEDSKVFVQASLITGNKKWKDYQISTSSSFVISSCEFCSDITSIMKAIIVASI